MALGLGWGLLPEQQCLTELGDGQLVELAPGPPIDVVLYGQRWHIVFRLLGEVTDAVGRVAAASLHPSGPARTRAVLSMCGGQTWGRWEARGQSLAHTSTSLIEVSAARSPPTPPTAMAIVSTIYVVLPFGIARL